MFIPKIFLLIINQMTENGIVALIDKTVACNSSSTNLSSKSYLPLHTFSPFEWKMTKTRDSWPSGWKRARRFWNNCFDHLLSTKCEDFGFSPPPCFMPKDVNHIIRKQSFLSSSLSLNLEALGCFLWRTYLKENRMCLSWCHIMWNSFLKGKSKQRWGLSFKL